MLRKAAGKSSRPTYITRSPNKPVDMREISGASCACLCLTIGSRKEKAPYVQFAKKVIANVQRTAQPIPICNWEYADTPSLGPWRPKRENWCSEESLLWADFPRKRLKIGPTAPPGQRMSSPSSKDQIAPFFRSSALSWHLDPQKRVLSQEKVNPKPISVCRLPLGIVEM